jgi:hypothetical protein
LGVPLGFFSFTSSFLQDALDDDVHYIHTLPRLGDVMVAFEILVHYFDKRFNYVFHYSPHFKICNANWPLLIQPYLHIWEALKIKFFWSD